MAHLIAMEANQIKYWSGGGSGAIPTNMTRSTALKAAITTHPARPIMRLAALATMALTLLASRSKIKYLRPLALTT